ncbi:MAG: DsrE family protein [Aquificaceae bacterium]|nr:DsrE family protein [Aquificaceae bacterium]
MNRRTLIGLFTLGMTLPFVSKASNRKLDFKDIKSTSELGVVYHCDFGQEDRFRTMLTNIRNHLSVYENNPLKLKVVVVAHGQGLKFFLKDLSETPWSQEQIKLSELHQQERDLNVTGVDFYICDITLNRLRVSREKLLDFVYIVPSGVATISHLQCVERFAYIKVQ